MGFCPLLSTADKKAECQSDCQWCFELDNGDLRCEINYISDRCQDLKLLDNIADNTALSAERRYR